jgi:putative chitinase
MADQEFPKGASSGRLLSGDLKTVIMTLTAGVISAVATIAAAYLGGFFDVAKTNAVSLGTMNLERLKFSNELVKSALNTTNPANSLLFYADIGLLDGLVLAKVKDYALRESERLKRGDAGTSLLPSFDQTVRPKLRLDREFFTAFTPGALPAYVDALVSTGNYLLLGFGISANPKRLSAFLGQLAHETDGFKIVVERANYSKGRLMAVWPDLFKAQNADEYVNKPEKALNLAYANRLGNGPESSGDGWRYRGRGFLQITGRGEYERFSKETGIDLISNPDNMGDPHVSLLIAASYWYNSGLNALADENRLVEITKKITGGRLVGLESRQSWAGLALKLLGEKDK